MAEHHISQEKDPTIRFTHTSRTLKRKMNDYYVERKNIWFGYLLGGCPPPPPPLEICVKVKGDNLFDSHSAETGT